ncbi:helix-turn-helix domain-containing protein [Pelagibacterium luteolum]|uniref:HTH cro/C1-type domain-containing protein n=1 Tax=Pelagibacterium luteolum TaxID=440168 RepID=A0A1G7UQK6_9HYPH|nr:helix-turn-helix transcriptional regulator [Pelagibacterium luteolum]SDG49531.1 hypothetical protein SAMN04487974_103203 [Pelagibacterium luteolum]
MNFGPVDANEAQIFAVEELRADVQYEVLRALKADGLKQADLAARLGCSAAWVSQLLSDDANLTLESVAKIFFALNRRWEGRVEPVDDHIQKVCGAEAGTRSSSWRQTESEEYQGHGTAATSKLLMAICRDTHSKRAYDAGLNDNGDFWMATKELA